jgi:Raf kinase inhibitor-like YbhB/YbcL family protein
VQISSADFSDGERMDRRFTCDGEDASPGLQWDDVPDGTAELALTCVDPDAPGGTFIHWVTWAIDPALGRIPAGSVPGMRHGRNDFGVSGYGGPCPPPGHGEHRYRFTLYALGEPIVLNNGATIDELRGAMKGRVLAEATLTGTYSR